jgi:hypothetical protein
MMTPLATFHAIGWIPTLRHCLVMSIILLGSQFQIILMAFRLILSGPGALFSDWSKIAWCRRSFVMGFSDVRLFQETSYFSFHTVYRTDFRIHRYIRIRLFRLSTFQCSAHFNPPPIISIAISFRSTYYFLCLFCCQLYLSLTY